jgi:hypothetical protein
MARGGELNVAAAARRATYMAWARARTSRNFFLVVPRDALGLVGAAVAIFHLDALDDRVDGRGAGSIGPASSAPMLV